MITVRGESSALYIGPEIAFGCPSTDIESVDWSPPLSVSSGGKLAEDPSISRTGFVKAAVQGEEGGAPFELELTVDPALALPYLVHLCGKVTKSSPAANVYKYTILPSLLPEAMQSLYAGFTARPLPHRWFFGIVLEELAVGLKPGLLMMKSKGKVQHGSRSGVAVADAGNAEAYPFTPWLRGSLKDPGAGVIHVAVSSVAPLKVRARQGAAPTVAAPELAVSYGLQGQASWLALRGEDGLDLGFISREVKKPLEIYFPGSVADHADLEVGDKWTFTAVAEEPDAPATIGDGRLSQFHLRCRVRNVGDATWLDLEAEDGSFDLKRKLDIVRGAGSAFPISLEPAAAAVASAAITSGLSNDFFQSRFERNQPLELQLLFEADQIDDDHRVGIELTFNHAQIEAEPKVQYKPGRVLQEVQFGAKEPPAGGPPFTIVVTSRRDWTIPAYA